MKSAIAFATDRAGNIQFALDWLDRALRLEAEGKSEKMVDMALDRACLFERHAFTLPA